MFTTAQIRKLVVDLGGLAPARDYCQRIADTQHSSAHADAAHRIGIWLAERERICD